ncbi:hypothetical protein HJC23_009955 [Cyclotella cryptica]|uniref:SET domain-containing protein n=1 Tax=Cyclotella cryptica TaxID=29204 RepID=A0ABD3Q8E5_9STRA|eukprot:CCRYP_007711-RA/>CCRYP_007711-RA protein AED:0.36 eAED:0.36 QI:0/-1/0/1/-1/1/1/0/631
MAQAIFSVALLLTAATFVFSREDTHQCGVYLAESSTGHFLGSFAGRAYQRDDIIGSQDAVVQFVDIRLNNQDLSEEDAANLEAFLGTCWSGDATAGMNEAEEVISAVGGPCFSSTGHVGMINAVIHQPSTLLRTDTDLLSSGYDEMSSPGRGAFTSYHNLTLLAVDKIQAGSEIFLDFGAEYNQYDDTSKPNIDDYRKMDEAMEKMVTFFNKHAESLGEKAANEVYDFMKKDVLDLTAEARAEAARSLLPETYHGLQAIIDVGGSALHSNPEVVKDMKWLEKEGYCQDNLVVGVSKIEHAGRAAIAARDIKKGEVVAPMPLVPIIKGRDVLTMTDYDDEDENKPPIKMKQFLTNYVLEHPQCSVLFFPAGPMTSFINHGGKKANVKMAWSTKSWSDVKAAQKASTDELPLFSSADMIIDLVATRNIKKGEEVLFDYGNDWANAWNEHVKNWKKLTKDAKLSKSAMVLNDEHHGVGKTAKPFPTSSEESIAGDNVQLMCHVLYDEDKIERRRNQDGSRTKVYPWIPHPTSGENRLKTDLAVRGINRMGCEILERTGDEANGYKYVVRPLIEKEGPKILVKNVPHEVIRYIDKPYSNPQHEQRAFRHTIRFPDDVFPEAWKDLRDGYKARDEL